MSLVAFFNPISVMAEGLRDYKVDSKMACVEFAKNHKDGGTTAAVAKSSSSAKAKNSKAAN